MNELLQIDAYRVALFTGITDDELALFGGIAKNIGYIPFMRAPNRGMVGRDCFDRQQGRVAVRVL